MCVSANFVRIADYRGLRDYTDSKTSVVIVWIWIYWIQGFSGFFDAIPISSLSELLIIADSGITRIQKIRAIR